MTYTLRDNLQGPAGATGPPGTVYDTDQVGTIKSFAGSVLPANWKLADGASLLRADYPDLFTAIGTTYGAADAAHFNLPDLTSKFVYGATGLGAQGGVGGAANKQITQAELPFDTLTGSGGAHWAWAQASGPADITRRNAAAAAFSILPPYILIAQIIKATGVQVNTGGALVGATGPAGAQGIQGPQGDVGPQGAAGAGGLLAVQRIIGANGAYKVITTGQRLTINAAGTTDLALSYTPPVNAWWEVHVLLGILNKTDAAYHYATLNLVLAPADADGLTGFTSYKTQHSTVQQYEPHTVPGLFKLTAGVPYQVYCTLTVTGGTWQYHQGNQQLLLHSKAWAR